MRNKIIIIETVLVILTLLFITACTQNNPELTADEIAVEKVAIEEVVTKFHQAIAEESWTNLKSLLTDDCIIYGTDVTDVDQGFAKLEPHMEQAFFLLDNSNIHDLKD
ncbi:hypothetical protein JW964_04890, partial [candidate division KSB1 bacterium]|nr:hypothetical protein [candidate division KSB1 bacterium]